MNETEKMHHDCLIYGAGFAEMRDGKVHHIPLQEVRMDINAVLETAERYDLHIHRVCDEDVKYMKVPLAFIVGSTHYIMHGSDIVFLGSREGAMGYIMRVGNGSQTLKPVGRFDHGGS